MSYLVLARKWRPKRFSELVGQQHVVRALAGGIESGRLHHAFLFTGTRGVGKTTIARILAKALNCEVGISADPCGVCSSCRDIDAGRFVDLLEIDAASRSKVDDTREVLDNVIYAPSRGRYKVYLIDEVHMLSTASFNALLKTLEEPPPHVKFLLATTDPQKLPVTVLSRCLQFSLKRLERAEIDAQMRRILDAEQLAYEPAAVAALARAADGSLRDGLSLLDQALGFGGGSVRLEDVLSMLGTIDRSSLAALALALTADDRPALRAELRRIGELSVDYSTLLAELLTLWHDIAARQVLGDDVESDVVDDAVLVQLADGLGPETVQLNYQLTLQARRDLDLAPDHRTGFEMAMLRLLAFRPAGGEASAPPRPAPVGAPERPAPRPQAAALAPAAAQPAASATARPATSASSLPGVPPVAAVVAAPARTGTESPWFEIVARADLRGPARELAAQLKPIAHQGVRWRVALAPHLESLNTPFARKALEDALRSALGAEAVVEIVARALDGGETLAERSQRARAERSAAAERDLQADPGLQSLTREFGARVVPGTLQMDS